MAILSNFYFHLDLSLSEDDKKRGEDYLKDLAEYFGSKLYRQDVEVKVNLEDGSLKIYLAIAGAIYVAIGQYGSFRSGLDYIKKDAVQIKEAIVGDLRKNGLRDDQIIQVKLVSSTVSRLRRIITRIEKLSSLKSSIDRDKYDKELLNIKRHLYRISADLEELDLGYIANELPKEYTDWIDMSKLPIPDKELLKSNDIFDRRRKIELDFKLNTHSSPLGIDPANLFGPSIDDTGYLEWKK